MPIILLAAALAVGIWQGQKKPAVRLGPSLRVDFVNVEQGDSIIIKTPDGASALIDAGEAEYGPRVVQRLRRMGIKRLDLVVMSHPHSDHIGGIPAVLNALQVKGILDSGYAHGSDTQERVLRLIEEKRIPYHRAQAGMEFRLGARARLEVLAPVPGLIRDSDSEANDNSVVIRLVYGSVRMLFTGDIEREGEGRLIASRQDLNSQVLKVAHHGAADSTSLELLHLVKPDYIIISVGADNEYGHPRRSTLNRLAKEKTDALLFRTDKNGTVTVSTDGHRIVVETER